MILDLFITHLIGASSPSPDELNQPVDLLVEPCLHLLKLVRSRGCLVSIPHYGRMRQGAKAGWVKEAGGGSRTWKGMGGLVLPMLRQELWFIMVVAGSYGIFLEMALGEGFAERLISHDSLKILSRLRESRLT